MKILHRTLFILAAAVLCQAVLADAPVFRNGLLTLPVVEDEGDTWTLELELVENTFPPEFILTHSR